VERSTVTDVVVEVGPVRIRGPNGVSFELESAALDGVDDQVVLVDEQPVRTAQVWRDVLKSVLGECVETVVLVCPTWWPSARVAVVRDAAQSTATNVVVLQRTRVLADGLAHVMVVEIAPDLVVVSRSGGIVMAEPRSGGVVDAVSQRLSGPVLIDAPGGVDARALAAAVTDRLHADGIAVSIADPDRVLRAATAMLAAQRRQATDFKCVGENRATRAKPFVAVPAAAMVSTAALCAAIALWPDNSSDPVAELPTTLLVEGRVAVKVPAQWTVQRITSGPGSARLQVVSPWDAETAVHITQSPVPPNQTAEITAQTLRRALDEQPAGVFVDFNPADRQADRPAVTYREVRSGHQVRWVVLVDDTVRIAVGCQSAADREQLVRPACDEAIRSARAVF
jgi:type VII secretion-associated protein (TIGR03931 family)